MYTVKDNQYLPNGLGNPAATYYYVVDDKNKIINKHTAKPYKGKQMDNYAFKRKIEALDYAAKLNNVAMIPKKDMVAGTYYKGFCRNCTVALWDGTKFLYLRNKFVYFMDTIEHFEDVKNRGTDGFVPIEEIQPIDSGTLRKVRVDVGY
jgi:hypothetical protein